MNTIMLINMALHVLLLSALGWGMVRWCIPDARHRAWASLLVLLVALVAPLFMEIRSEVATTVTEEAPAAPVASWKPDWKFSTSFAAPVPNFTETATELPATPSPVWTLTDLARWTCVLWIAGTFALAVLLSVLSVASWRWRRSLRPPTATEMDLLPSVASRYALRVSEDEGGPCVVGLWQPVIAVPHRIIGKWNSRQWTWLLRHEGEHVRSRDTLTVWLLGWTKVLVWWNPFVHALVEQWSQAREEICDMAAVRAEGDPAAYSGFLLDIATGSRVSSPLMLHMAASRPARRLRARMVAMLAQRRVRERASRVFQLGALVVMASIAAIVSCVGLKAEDAPAKETPKSANAPSKDLTELKFATGEKRLAAGDDVVIEKVLCSSPNFAIGDRVVVKGRYTLASEADARLSLHLTSIKPSGKWPISPEQTVTVQRGTGAFELSHIIRAEGVLHVSFYPTKGGSELGGVYFGTQEQVKRSTTFTHKVDQIGGSAASRTPGGPEAGVIVKEAASNGIPPKEVKFVVGRKQFAEGDEIVIDKILCSSGEFKPGDRVVVQGHYKLASIPKARLALSLSSFANGGRGRWQPKQYGDVERGSGTFERTEDIQFDGSLHVSFYDMTVGKSIGGIYFGTHQQVDQP